MKPASFKKRYGDVFDGDANWKKVKLVKGQTYQWDIGFDLCEEPALFRRHDDQARSRWRKSTGARVLALFGDCITTDHISPAGNIKATAPGGVYLSERQVAQKDFNSYGSRRGNYRSDGARHLRQYPHPQRDDGRQGRRQHDLLRRRPMRRARPCRSSTRPRPTRRTAIGTVVIGGKEYGTGSSRDWAAKGPKLLGVRAVITESFERIHRSNLIGMGVAPFCFEAGKTRKDYGFTGREVIDIPGLSGELKPRHADGSHRPSSRRHAASSCRCI